MLHVMDRKCASYNVLHSCTFLLFLFVNSIVSPFVLEALNMVSELHLKSIYDCGFAVQCTVISAILHHFDGECNAS